MELSFGQVERALALGQNIRDDRRSAFANRLKNYQKASFPDGINTGRGRAAAYRIGHLWQLGVALEFNQIGLSPERAVSVIRTHSRELLSAAIMAGKAGPPDGKFRSPICIYFDPAALSDLMFDRPEDRSSRSFNVGFLSDAKKSIDKWMQGGASRVAFVNASALAYDLASYGSAGLGVSITDFYEALSTWAVREGANGRNKKA